MAVTEEVGTRAAWSESGRLRGYQKRRGRAPGIYQQLQLLSSNFGQSIAGHTICR